MNRAEFVDAWRLWDDQPASPTRAGRFEELCQELAGELGISTRVLRHELAAEVREIGNRNDALSRLVERYKEDANAT